MIPAPNFIAGLLIGLANTSWLAVVLACLAWPFVFCAYVGIADAARRDATVEHFRTNSRRLLSDSPVLTFYAIEFSTALTTSLFVACIAHLVKRLVT